jgi:hypothetical protein
MTKDGITPRQQAEMRHKSMEAEKNSWTPSWKTIRQFINPTKGFFDDQPNQGSLIDHKTVLDGIGRKSSRTMAAGMVSGLSSPTRPWFKLGIDGKDELTEEEKVWIDGVEKKMMGVFQNSNTYGALYSVYEECGSFSTAATAVLEDYDDVIRLRNFTIGEYALSCDEKGNVNGFSRKLWMTVDQVVSQFGLESCSPSVQMAYQQKRYDQWVRVSHLIDKNDSRDEKYQDFHHMPFRGRYWETGSMDKDFLSVEGFEEFPILAPRWDTTTSADIYGKGSPGWDAVGDTKMVQKLHKLKLLSLEKEADPPLQKDSSVDRVNSLAGGITSYSAQVRDVGVKPIYQVSPNTAAVQQVIQETKREVQEWFYVDLFLMMTSMDRSNVTAREIVERHEEKLLMLGPVIDRLQKELLSPLIKRTFSIMFRLGMIDPPPESVQGRSVDSVFRIEYISMLAQAQKMVWTAVIEQVVAFAGNLAAAKPEVLDGIDFDETLRQYSGMLGVPPKILASKITVDSLRKARAEQAAQAAAMQNAGAAVQGAKVMSDTKIGQGSALDALMGANA